MEQIFVVLSYIDDCVYWYTAETLGKWFLDTLGKRFHMNFLVSAHWFMSIRISHMKYHSISVYQDRYDTSILYKYLYTSIVNKSIKFYKITITYYKIFTKDGVFTSDEKV